MNITDELRGFANSGMSAMECSAYSDKLIAIADRIDAEHEKAMSRAGQLLADAEKDRDYNYANWQECKQKVLQGNITFGELNAKIECLEDELSHRIELPKDADGEPIHVGDEVYQVEGGWVYTVESIRFYPDNTTVTFSCKHGFGCDSAHNVRHYHAPTVEDVIRDTIFRCIGHLPEYWDEPIAECAAKLRLAEESSSLGTIEED